MADFPEGLAIPDVPEILDLPAFNVGPLNPQWRDYSQMGWIKNLEFATAGHPGETETLAASAGTQNRPSVQLFEQLAFLRQHVESIDDALVEYIDEWVANLTDWILTQIPEETVIDAAYIKAQLTEAIGGGITNDDVEQPLIANLEQDGINESKLWLTLREVVRPDITSIFSPRYAHQSVVFGGSLWVYGGKNKEGDAINDVWSSVDGQDWGLISSSPWVNGRFGHQAVAFDGKMWTFGGHNGTDYLKDVWYSDISGANWTKASELGVAWDKREGHQIVITGSDPNEVLWLTGGQAESDLEVVSLRNDVYRSQDGLTWVEMTASAAFSARRDHASFQINGEVFVAGGHDGVDYLDDVWKSSDGVNWEQVVVTNSEGGSPWAARRKHKVIEADGAIYLVGGEGDGVVYDDVWVTTDGAEWTQVAVDEDNAIPVRYSHQLAWFLDKLWLIGGQNGNAVGTSDIYSSEVDDEADPGDPGENLGEVWVSLTGFIVQNFSSTKELAEFVVALNTKLEEFLASQSRSVLQSVNNLEAVTPSGFLLQYKFPKTITTLKDPFFIEEDLNRLLCVDDGTLIQACPKDSRVVFNGRFFQISNTIVGFTPVGQISFPNVSGVDLDPCLMYATEATDGIVPEFFRHHAPNPSMSDSEANIMDVGARQDLVIIEFWKEIVPDAGGKVFPYGNIYYNPSKSSQLFLQALNNPDAGAQIEYTYSSNAVSISDEDFPEMLQDSKHHIELIPGELGLENSTYSQWRFRVRVVEGERSIQNVHPIGSERDENDQYLYRPISYEDGDKNRDPGWFIAESSLPLDAQDPIDSRKHGYSLNNQLSWTYAIPVCVLQRRNRGVWHPEYNPNGSARVAKDFTTGEDLSIESISDCFDPNKIAVVRVTDPTDDLEAVVPFWTDSDRTDGEMPEFSETTGWSTAAALGWTDEIEGPDTDLYKDDRRGRWYRTGSVLSTVSGRPDNMFFDHVTQSDVLDLRHSVSLTGWDLELILRQSLDLLLQGELKTDWADLKRRGEEGDFSESSGIFGTDILQIDAIYPEGEEPSDIVSSVIQNIVVTSNHTHTFCDGMRRSFSDEGETIAYEEIVGTGLFVSNNWQQLPDGDSPFEDSLFIVEGSPKGPILDADFSYSGSGIDRVTLTLGGHISGDNYVKPDPENGAVDYSVTDRVVQFSDETEYYAIEYVEDISPWERKTEYSAKDLIYTSDGKAWMCSTSHTSGTSFSESNWVPIRLEEFYKKATGISVNSSRGRTVEIHFDEVSWGTGAPDQVLPGLVFRVQFGLEYLRGGGVRHMTWDRPIIQDGYGYNMTPLDPRGGSEYIHKLWRNNMGSVRFYSNVDSSKFFGNTFPYLREDPNFNLTPIGQSIDAWKKNVVGNQPWTPRFWHKCVNHNDRIYLVGGVPDSGQFNDILPDALQIQAGDPSSDVWSSQDGVSWQNHTLQANFPKRTKFELVSFDDGSGSRLWLMGGRDVNGNLLNDVWKSDDIDGETWIPMGSADWSPRRDFKAVVFTPEGESDPVLFVMGGFTSNNQYANDVWRYDPLSNTWSKTLVGDAPWAQRRGHQTIRFNGYTWLLGGQTATVADNQVWVSQDNISWTRIDEPGNPSNKWSARTDHQALVFNGKMWVLGGKLQNGSLRNDIWSSVDGITWVQEKAHDGSASPVDVWSARAGHRAVWGNGKAHVIGGYDINGEFKNDHWTSTDLVTWTEVDTTNNLIYEQEEAKDTLRFYPAISSTGNPILLAVPLGSVSFVKAVKSYFWKSTDYADWSLDTVRLGANRTQQAHWHYDAADNRYYAPIWKYSSNAGENVMLQSGIDEDGELTAVTHVGSDLESEDHFSGGHMIRLPDPDGALVVFGGIYEEGPNENLPMMKIFKNVGGGNFTYVADLPGSDRIGIQTVVFDDKLWIIGGRSTDGLTFYPNIYWTIDGIEWNEVVAPTADDGGGAEPFPGMVVERVINEAADAVLIIGYYTGLLPQDRTTTILRSTDMQTWANPDTTNPLTSDQGINYGALVDSGNIYIIHGQDSNGDPVKEIWKKDISVDWTGQWEKVISEVPWAGRRNHALSAVGQNLILTGGYSNASIYGDCWISTDGGQLWEQGPSIPGAKNGIHSHTMNTFNSFTTIVGGLRPGFSGGGYNTEDFFASFPSNLFNLANYTWGKKSTSIPGVYGHSTVVVGQELFRIGGRSASGFENYTYKYSRPSGFSVTSGGVVTGDLTRIKTNSSAFWTPRQAFSACVHDGEMYVFGGTGGSGNLGDLWKTSDGIGWEQVTPDNGPWYSDANMLSHNGHLYIVNGLFQNRGVDDAYLFDGAVARFDESIGDFRLFRARSQYGNRAFDQAVSFGGKLWVLGGLGEDGYSKGDAWSSPFGNTWTDVRITGNTPWSGRHSFGLTTFDDRLVLAGGSGESGRTKDLWVSENGQSWEEKPTPDWAEALEDFVMIEYGGLLYVLGGYSDSGYQKTIYTTYDLESWNEITIEDPHIWFSARRGHRGVIFKNKLWIVGGQTIGDGLLNDVWSYNLDTDSWTNVKANVPDPEPSDNIFTPRKDFGLVVHGGYLYVMGGEDSDGNRISDVWRSSTGVEWEEVSSPPWTARSGHTLAAVDSKIYLMGGIGPIAGETEERSNEIWSTVDGENWTQVFVSAPWEKRSHHKTVLYDGNIILIGGIDIVGDPLGDVWYSDQGPGSKKTVHLDDVMLPFWKGRDVWIYPSIKSRGAEWYHSRGRWEPEELNPEWNHVRRLKGPNNYHELGPVDWQNNLVQGTATDGWDVDGSGGLQCYWDRRRRKIVLENGHPTKTYESCALMFWYFDAGIQYLYDFNIYTKSFRRVSKVEKMEYLWNGPELEAKDFYGFGQIVRDGNEVVWRSAEVDFDSDIVTYRLQGGRPEDRVIFDPFGFFASFDADAVPIWLEDTRDYIAETGETNPNKGRYYLTYGGYRLGFNRKHQLNNEWKFGPQTDLFVNCWFCCYNAYAQYEVEVDIPRNERPNVDNLESGVAWYNEYEPNIFWHPTLGDSVPNTPGALTPTKLYAVKPGFKAHLWYQQSGENQSRIPGPRAAKDNEIGWKDSFFKIIYLRTPRTAFAAEDEVYGILPQQPLIISNSGSGGIRRHANLRPLQAGDTIQAFLADENVDIHKVYKRGDYRRYKFMTEFINTTRPPYFYDPNTPINIIGVGEGVENEVSLLFSTDWNEVDTSAFLLPVATMIRNHRYITEDFQRANEQDLKANYFSNVFKFHKTNTDIDDTDNVSTRNDQVLREDGTLGVGSGPHNNARNQQAPMPAHEIQSPGQHMWLSPNVYTRNGELLGIMLDYEIEQYIWPGEYYEAGVFENKSYASFIDTRFRLMGRPIFKNNV